LLLPRRLPYRVSEGKLSCRVHGCGIDAFTKQSRNVTFFIEECRSLGIKVLGPHVNESGIYFAVNKDGEIRFGLGAIKGAGDAAVEAIILEREANGLFVDIFDFAKRLTQRSVTKKTFECLALSGAFDCF
jgi:DNA polymerase-3 subunit alpha